MKLKHIAAAALAAVSMSSFAAIISPTTQNSELFAVVYDSVDQVSYTIDLGLQMDAGGTSPQFSNTSTYTFTLNSANWTSFLGVANTTANTLQYAVFAGDTSGTSVANPSRLWSTVSTTSPTFSQGNVTAGTTALANYADAQLSTSLHTTHGTQTNGDSYDTVGNAAYAAGDYNIVTLGNQVTGWAPFNDQGTAVQFMQFTKTSTSNSAASGKSLINDPNFVWNFTQSAGQYQLTYSAVPDADGLALVLAGLGAMGFVARRRAAR